MSTPSIPCLGRENSNLKNKEVEKKRENFYLSASGGKNKTQMPPLVVLESLGIRPMRALKNPNSISECNLRIANFFCFCKEKLIEYQVN